jgi:hypothetical protein
MTSLYRLVEIAPKKEQRAPAPAARDPVAPDPVVESHPRAEPKVDRRFSDREVRLPREQLGSGCRQAARVCRLLRELRVARLELQRAIRNGGGD